MHDYSAYTHHMGIYIDISDHDLATACASQQDIELPSERKSESSLQCARERA